MTEPTNQELAKLNALLTKFANANFDCGAHEWIVKQQGYGPTTAAERYHRLSESEDEARAALYKFYQDAALSTKPESETADRFETPGYALAMSVLQSDLYHKLDDKERAECDELIKRGQNKP